LPLGSQEWAKVQERYNSFYASKNNWAIRKPDSIQNKFCALVNQFKPTGNPHIRDAKDTQKLMTIAQVSLPLMIKTLKMKSEFFLPFYSVLI
jgi:hypothetical protein